MLFGQPEPRHVSQRITPRHTFDSAEMGVIAHLYRGEVYRSTIWRTRLDNTCACRKSNPNILVMQPAQDWKAKNTPCLLNRAR